MGLHPGLQRVGIGKGGEGNWEGPRQEEKAEAAARTRLPGSEASLGVSVFVCAFMCVAGVRRGWRGQAPCLHPALSQEPSDAGGHRRGTSLRRAPGAQGGGTPCPASFQAGPSPTRPRRGAGPELGGGAGGVWEVAATVAAELSDSHRKVRALWGGVVLLWAGFSVPSSPCSAWDFHLRVPSGGPSTAPWFPAHPHPVVRVREGFLPTSGFQLHPPCPVVTCLRF